MTLLLIVSCKALASSKIDTLPTKFHPIQIDSFVCFPIYEAGSILDSLNGCRGLYFYTLELEKESLLCNDMVFGLRSELEVQERKALNLEQQNNLLNGSLSIMQDKEYLYREQLGAQAKYIELQRKQIKRAKRGKTIAWTVATGLGGVLVYFIIKSI